MLICKYNGVFFLTSRLIIRFHGDDDDIKETVLRECLNDVYCIIEADSCHGDTKPSLPQCKFTVTLTRYQSADGAAPCSKL